MREPLTEAEIKAAHYQKDKFSMGWTEKALALNEALLSAMAERQINAEAFHRMREERDLWRKRCEEVEKSCSSCCLGLEDRQKESKSL